MAKQTEFKVEFKDYSEPVPPPRSDPPTLHKGVVDTEPNREAILVWIYIVIIITLTTFIAMTGG